MLQSTSSAVKRRCRVFPADKQACTNSIGPPHSGENCFLHLFWNLNRPARASQYLLEGENGDVRCFAHINRLVPASQDFPIGENWSFLALKRACTCFTALPRRWKRRCRVFPTHNRFAPASQDLQRGENCFLDLYWNLNRPHVLHSTSSAFKTAFEVVSRT